MKITKMEKGWRRLTRITNNELEISMLTFFQDAQIPM